MLRAAQLEGILETLQFPFCNSKTLKVTGMEMDELA